MFEEHSGAMSVAVTVDDDVAAVRGFNRFYTRDLGLLGSGFLDSEHSLTEVASRFSLSRERIRQLEIQALGRLRELARAEGLAAA